MEISRRRFIAGASMISLASLLPRRVLLEALATPGPLLFFDDHQASVVREATARLIPGPEDDPAETGHPGAREAGAVRYIDTLLGAFSLATPPIFAGGPWSDRAGGTQNHMAQFVTLSAAQEQIWRDRIAGLQTAYRDGIAAYDAAAGGDFTAASPLEQDGVLAQDQSGFRDVLFTHAIEGMFSVPEYGGNSGLAGWAEIGFRGDTQPVGYSAAEVTNSDGLDPVDPLGVLPDLLQNFEQAARLLAARRPGGR